MGILVKLLAPNIKAYAPDDDFWYTSRVTKSLTGLYVTPETALCISTVFRCVSAIAQDIAGMPLIIYRRLEHGKERASSHPLYDVLHDRPNQWQTSFEWREMMMGHLLLRGNAYNLIQAGPRGFADQLIPLNPARMKVEQLANHSLRYTYTWEKLQKEVYTQDEIFHLRGLSSDGITGLSVVALARESMGLGLATEQYGARFFSQDASPGGVLQVKGTLSDEASKRLERSWGNAHSGLGKSHGTAVLEEGTTWHQIGLSNEDAQFLATRSFQIEEMARWFGVPLHRIGHTEKATSWGTGIEQFNLGYVMFTLMSWVRRFEQGISRDLILAPQTFFPEFLLDHLLRGDIKSRYNAYRTAITTGWMTRNEAREKENWNPVEGLDDMLVPLNMATVDEGGDIHPLNKRDAVKTSDNSPPAVPPPTGLDNRAWMLASEAASRVVRKETQAVARAAKRYADDPDGYQTWSEEFWGDHAGFVAEVLHLDAEVAEGYAADCKALSLEEFERTVDQRTTELATMALKEVKDHAIA